MDSFFVINKEKRTIGILSKTGSLYKGSFANPLYNEKTLSIRDWQNIVFTKNHWKKVPHFTDKYLFLANDCLINIESYLKRFVDIKKIHSYGLNYYKTGEKILNYKKITSNQSATCLLKKLCKDDDSFNNIVKVIGIDNLRAYLICLFGFVIEAEHQKLLELEAKREEKQKHLSLAYKKLRKAQNKKEG